MKIRIKRDCKCEKDLHEMTFYPRSWYKAKPALKAGAEYLYDGEQYTNCYGLYLVVHTPDGEYHIDPRHCEVFGSSPAWVTVDSNGQEAKHYGFKPKRCSIAYATLDPIRPHRYGIYWVSKETGRIEHFNGKSYGLVYHRENLEPGTIEQLIGRKLTVNDEPVQIE